MYDYVFESSSSSDAVEWGSKPAGMVRISADELAQAPRRRFLAAMPLYYSLLQKRSNRKVESKEFQACLEAQDVGSTCCQCRGGNGQRIIRFLREFSCFEYIKIASSSYLAAEVSSQGQRVSVLRVMYTRG